jgi:hypothetical protein
MRHENDRGGNAENRNTALLDTVDEQSFDAVDVFDDAGEQIAGGALVEPGDGQALQPGVNIAAHVVDDILFERIVDANAQAVKQFAKEECADQAQRGRRQPIVSVLLDDIIDDDVSELGINKSGCERQNGEANRAGDHQFIRSQINADAPDNFARGARAGVERRVGAGAAIWVGHGGVLRFTCCVLRDLRNPRSLCRRALGPWECGWKSGCRR